MCLIIDADVVHKVYSAPPHEDGAPIIDWIDRGRGLLVFGGEAETRDFKERGRYTLVEGADPGWPGNSDSGQESISQGKATPNVQVD